MSMLDSRGPKLAVVPLVMTISLLPQAALAAATFTEYVVPTPASQPLGITPGPDGNLWFTEDSGNKIGKVTTGGTFTEYAVPTPASDPVDITPGPDGNLWFTEILGDKIGKVTTGGTFTEYAVPTPNGGPFGITPGPDGNLWFTEAFSNKIGKVTTGGTFTEYAVPTAASNPLFITPGPDGNLWFTEQNGNKIGKVTTSGTVTEYAVPTAASRPIDITPGSDGNVWFTEFNGNNIGKVTTGGTFTEYVVPTAASQPQGITAGPDGNLWFTEGSGNKIGRITAVPTTPSELSAVVGQLQTAGCIDNVGIANALIAKLSAAQSAITAGDIKTATNTLTAFIDQVSAQSSKHILTSCGGLTVDPATMLIADAQSLINGLTLSATSNPLTGSVVTSAGSAVAGATLSLVNSSGTTVATATTDITGFYYFATTGLLSSGATYSVSVTGLPTGVTTASALVQTLTWSGGALTLSNFTLS